MHMHFFVTLKLDENQTHILIYGSEWKFSQELCISLLSFLAGVMFE